MSLYYLHARLFPSILTSLPMLILWYFLRLDTVLAQIEEYLSNLSFYGEVSLSVVLFYFYSQLIRSTSKFMEEKYFSKEGQFPTTYFVTYADPYYSDVYKDKFRCKVKRLFDLELLDANHERDDLVEAQKRIREATKHVILLLGIGQLVLKHNIWYGFTRNFIGGTPYAILACLVNIAIGRLENTVLSGLSLSLLLVYSLAFLFRRRILAQYAEAYARQLIAEFMMKE